MGRLFDIAESSGGSAKAVTLAQELLSRERRELSNVFLQLTPLCNLKCTMCYARMDQSDVRASGGHIMCFDEWKYYIDAAADMGVYTLSLTGGECTIHPDFKKIYAYAYDRGLNLYILTNLSNIDDELFDLWMNKPPSSISFTVYGSSPETYERLCFNRDACYKVYANAERLMSHGFPLQPKFNCVHDNINDMEAVEKYFRDRGFKIKIGDTLMRFGNCEHETIDLEKVEQEEFREKSLKIWCDRTGKTIEAGREAQKRSLEYDCMKTPKEPPALKGVGCSAGRTQCHINWRGMMTPCVSLDSYQLDPRVLGFRQCWDKIVKWADEVPAMTECACCVFRKRCISCIAYHYNDLGVYGKPSERLCWKRKYPDKAASEIKGLVEKGLLRTDEI